MIKITFDQKGTFEAYWAAEQWCRDNGLSYGSMCYPDPTGLRYGNHVIMKWRHLSKKECKALDGTITGEFREGPVTIEVKEK
jgi:hypothetical protein